MFSIIDAASCEDKTVSATCVRMASPRRLTQRAAQLLPHGRRLRAHTSPRPPHVAAYSVDLFRPTSTWSGAIVAGDLHVYLAGVVSVVLMDATNWPSSSVVVGPVARSWSPPACSPDRREKTDARPMEKATTALSWIHVIVTDVFRISCYPSCSSLLAGNQ